jgi:uncharacterized membrane protein YobD (UPF0266 family)
MEGVSFMFLQLAIMHTYIFFIKSGIRVLRSKGFEGALNELSFQKHTKAMTDM